MTIRLLELSTQHASLGLRRTDQVSNPRQARGLQQRGFAVASMSDTQRHAAAGGSKPLRIAILNCPGSERYDECFKTWLSPEATGQPVPPAARCPLPLPVRWRYLASCAARGLGASLRSCTPFGPAHIIQCISTQLEAPEHPRPASGFAQCCEEPNRPASRQQGTRIRPVLLGFASLHS